MAPAVLVTGSATGFGMEIALYLGERGFRVYAGMGDLSCRMELGEAAQRRNVTLHVLEVDVRRPATIEAAVQTIVEQAGAIFGVVNNDMCFLRGYFEDCSDEEIRAVFDTNLFGTMAVTRAALPHMRLAHRGRIVIISSVAGKVGAPTSTAYSASRFAQEGFAEALYQEVTPLWLSVSLIETGISKTESWTIDRAAAARARDPEGPYYAWFTRAEQLFDQRLQRSPIMPHYIAAAVHRALTDRQPRLRYIVGLLPRLVINARRYSPGEVFDRWYFAQVMRRITGGRHAGTQRVKQSRHEIRES